MLSNNALTRLVASPLPARRVWSGYTRVTHLSGLMVIGPCVCVCGDLLYLISLNIHNGYDTNEVKWEGL